ncbi:ureidoglycolate lyase [Defluviimonas sp. WL0002]|uniref:Ureidoglycolate lyase n=1 Tax=Albidovulum marisflavi TaxID=2984159 RepID=A0ABT2ZE64_9RHOB|nr:ureidoglycolate lyase [Defluviimonas sp. WL0002]MCV2869414.1 ureidoglycolate lyase [Defluviimonas sp. WL0002]
MNRTIHAEPLSRTSFAPFGDVLDATGDYRLINEGLCRRHHDLARLDFGSGCAGISIFNAEPRGIPYEFDLVERHPEGSQAFLPMTEHPFLVIVALDEGGAPGRPRAFVTAPGQGINLHRGTWHGVLTPLRAPGLFAVVDRIGDGPNLEEYRYSAPWRVTT